MIENWQEIITKAWSIRLILLGGLFAGLEVFLSLAEGILPIEPGIFAIVSALASVGAFVTRLLNQQSITGGKQNGSISGGCEKSAR